MHIPDGYLSPQTYIPAYGVMLPLWWRASVKLKKTLRNRQVPILALGAAFSFMIMMFNVPVAGGTTGHAVGGVLVAILLGPWAAMVAVALALVVQALMFGDGGITVLGANCVNMAVVMPFVGWGVYKLIARNAPADSRRQVVAAAAGGYVGLNAAALTAAIMFGIQPLIAHDAAGHALNCPFGLRVAIPAMCGSHLVVFGVIEAIVSGLVVAYLQRVEPSLLPGECKARGKSGTLSPAARIGAVVAALIILSPLGLYLPARFGAGSAWGEWSNAEITRIAGYLPSGLRHAGYKAPMPDYAARGAGSAPLRVQSVEYIIAGVIGITVIAVLVYLLRTLIWRRKDEGDPAVDASINDN